MRVFIYNGGLRLVGKSGVGQAILHQREMLRRARIDTADIGASGPGPSISTRCCRIRCWRLWRPS